MAFQENYAATIKSRRQPNLVWRKTSSRPSRPYARIVHAAEVGERVLVEFAVVCFLMTLTLTTTAQETRNDQVLSFDIPQQRADFALTEFAEQADLTLIFPIEGVRDITANRLLGDFSVTEAVELLLAGTNLKPSFSSLVTLSIAVNTQPDTGENEMDKKQKAGIGALVAALFSVNAVAQDQTQAPTNSNDTIEEVVVTGSRIVRRDYVSFSPITTVGEDFINETGATTLEEVLAELPQFGIGSGTTTTGFFASGQAILSLRGLGPNRNLVLMDGRRMQPSNSQQVVDINMIPKAVIQSVEVITGGASAVYGSDAIAGVVNFIVKREFEGIQIDALYNDTENYGGATTDISLTVGGNFFADKGNAFLSLSYTDRDSVNSHEIDFLQQDPGQGDLRTGQGTYNPGVNGPTQASLDAVFGGYGIAAGAVPTNSFLSFNEDNSLFGATNGLSNFNGGFGLRAAGDQIAYTQVASISQTPLERYTVFSRATYEIAPGVEFFAQAQFAKFDTTTQAEAGNTTLTIPVTHPGIPTDLATLLASRADPLGPVLLEKRFFGIGPRQFRRSFDIFQVQAGLTGKFDKIDGGWEVYGSHGSTDVETITANSVIRTQLSDILNAADGGASLCDGGYNPFGLSVVSKDCQDFMAASLLQRTMLTQDNIEANFQGRITVLPAGEMRFASGVSYRSNKYDFNPDRDITNGTAVGIISAGASAGSTNVTELYAELLIPLLADVTGFQSLDTNVAYRYSDYNLAGGVDTYKADLSWVPVDSLRFRGGFQRAVRAPNVGELFIAPSSGFASIGEVANGDGDPCAASNAQGDAQIEALCVAQGVPAPLISTFVNVQNEIESTRVGNELLTPESADTYTVGVIFESSFESAALNDFVVSVDYYNIEIDDVIGVTSGGRVLDKCFNKDGSNPSFDVNNFNCQLLTRNTATGRLDNVLEPTVNLAAIKTQGVDLQLDWGMDVGSSDARISVNSIISHILEFEVQASESAEFDDFKGTVGPTTRGQIGSLPEWKANTRFRYQNGAWTGGLRWKFIDEMRSLSTVTNPNSTTPGTDSSHIFDLFGSWQMNDMLVLTAGINNLADTSPPVVDGNPGRTEPTTFEILGRTFYIGARAKF